MGIFFSLVWLLLQIPHNAKMIPFMVSLLENLKIPIQYFGCLETKYVPIFEIYGVKNIGINPDITIRSSKMIIWRSKKTILTAEQGESWFSVLWIFKWRIFIFRNSAFHWRRHIFYSSWLMFLCSINTKIYSIWYRIWYRI